MCGETPTLADHAISAMLMYAERAKLPLEAHGNVMRWFRDVQATEAWQRTEPQR